MDQKGPDTYDEDYDRMLEIKNFLKEDMTSLEYPQLFSYMTFYRINGLIDESLVKNLEAWLTSKSHSLDNNQFINISNILMSLQKYTPQNVALIE